MGMTLIEKIIAAHSKFTSVSPGQIVDISIDVRVARDFGGANVVRNLQDFGLKVDDPSKTLFTFDCNPTGSDQKYAVNQHLCRIFARENNIRVFDIDAGIGTHILIDEGFAYPGSTVVSTDSHANVLGAIGAFGQGMGDMDIAAAWNSGKLWFKVPQSVLIRLSGNFSPDISSKDIILNLLAMFGANSLLGYSIELCGDSIDELSIDDRITISSMATEMGAIIILFPPNEEIINYCRSHSSVKFMPLFADEDARYEKEIDIDASKFTPMVSRPGEPHDAVGISGLGVIKIDSAFIGSCTNGRMSDMRKAALILKNHKVAPGVVLKIVPATDEIWNHCLDEGLIEIFKRSGALVSNAGCAGCAAGQVGQNGQGEITISTGNRNFPGKQGKGSVYLASPEVVAASAIAGFITTSDKIPSTPMGFSTGGGNTPVRKVAKKEMIEERKTILEGSAWIIEKDNIDTDMIFHNRYLSITDIREMGQYAFDNLKGHEDFSRIAKSGDFIITGRNFGSGSSRQQAVDCFISLGLSGIIAESFGAIYERNAINAAFPVIICKKIADLELKSEDKIRVDLGSGKIINMNSGKSVLGEPLNEVQLEIYIKGGLLG
jgi:3-isopropylmalate/(R)-2-methylmalate dehydratase large subunit